MVLTEPLYTCLLNIHHIQYYRWNTARHHAKISISESGNAQPFLQTPHTHKLMWDCHIYFHCWRMEQHPRVSLWLIPPQTQFSWALCSFHVRIYHSHLLDTIICTCLFLTQTLSLYSSCSSLQLLSLFPSSEEYIFPFIPYPLSLD